MIRNSTCSSTSEPALPSAGTLPFSTLPNTQHKVLNVASNKNCVPAVCYLQKDVRQPAKHNPVSVNPLSRVLPHQKRSLLKWSTVPVNEASDLVFAGSQAEILCSGHVHAH